MDSFCPLIWRQSSTKVREMFRQINRNCWPQRPKIWTNCLDISLLLHFIFSASSTRQFPIYFLRRVYCATVNTKNNRSPKVRGLNFLQIRRRTLLSET